MDGLFPIIALVIAVACGIVVVLAKRKKHPQAESSTKQAQPQPVRRPAEPHPSNNLLSEFVGLGAELPGGTVGNQPAPVAQLRQIASESSPESRLLTDYKAAFLACQNEDEGILDGASLILSGATLTLKTTYTAAPLKAEIFLKDAGGKMAYVSGSNDNAVRFGETGIEGHVQVEVQDQKMVSIVRTAQVRVYNAELGVRAVAQLEVEKIDQ